MTRSRALSLSLLLVAGLPAACHDDAIAPQEASFRGGIARPAPVIRLVESDAKISGEVRGDDAVIERWSGDALRLWPLRTEGSIVTLLSPELGHIRDVGFVQVDLAAGGAQRLDLIPTMSGDEGAAMRRVRSIEVPLEQNLPPDTVLRFRIDVGETLRGNWGDGVRDGTLVRLELRLIGASSASVRLESLSLLRRNAIARPFAARRAIAERDGRLHPSWWVRGGCAAEFDTELPAGEPELRWLEGGFATGEEPRVELFAAGTRIVLSGPGRSKGELGWRSGRASLARWAGQRVVIRLSNRGTGVALFGQPRVVSAPPSNRPSDIVVYLIDTLRADHVAAFGARFDGITPTLDRLIGEGVGFEMALSHSPWTKPTIATLLTGLLPTTHRVGSQTLSDRMPGSVVMIQERFRSAGWRTGSFAANPLGSTLSGLERGFGTAVAPRFWRRPELGQHPSAAQLRGELLRWIDMEPDRPFFAYLHVMEVHPEGRRHHGRDRPEGFTPYAASVRAADADLGALLRSLEERGRIDGLLLVVLGDHGDSFGEHGGRWGGHGTSLFQEQIHVPLVFWRRGGPHREPIGDPVGLADVSPTLIDLFGLPPLEHADGVTLAAHWSDGDGETRPVPSALIRFPHRRDAPVQHSVVYPDGLKALRLGEEQRLTFDLRKDPGETRSASPPPGADALLRDLDRRIDAYPARASAFRERHGTPQAIAVDADDMQRLRQLGYVP